MKKTNDRTEADHSLTSRRIAYSLIAIFAFGLVLVLVGAFVFEGDGAPGPWLDIFKSGFLILGGSLSSIIGYYFGSRGTQIAEEGAREMQLQLEQQNRILEEKDDLAKLLQQQLAAAEQGLIDSDGIEEGYTPDDIQEFRLGREAQ